jgi:hypothetical protein
VVCHWRRRQPSRIDGRCCRCHFADGASGTRRDGGGSSVRDFTRDVTCGESGDVRKKTENQSKKKKKTRNILNG